jgi:hypothetical protein
MYRTNKFSKYYSLIRQGVDNGFSDAVIICSLMNEQDCEGDFINKAEAEDLVERFHEISHSNKRKHVSSEGPTPKKYKNNTIVIPVNKNGGHGKIAMQFFFLPT